MHHHLTLKKILKKYIFVPVLGECILNEKIKCWKVMRVHIEGGGMEMIMMAVTNA